MHYIKINYNQDTTMGEDSSDDKSQQNEDIQKKTLKPHERAKTAFYPVNTPQTLQPEERPPTTILVHGSS